ncbi:MAG: Cohesin domain protein [Ruminococcus sp.]|nr:Cohesin domain protein [Ruminococcus sp.]
MKTKKIVIGAMAAAMLSLSVCSLAPAAAADETVQISVSKTTAEAGGQFTVDVSLADIPAAGIQVLNFSLKFDSSLITIDSVTPGAATETGAGSADPTAASLENFNSYTESEGVVAVMWSTGLDDASYWIKNDGVYCTVTGTVSDTAAAGTVADIEIVPVARETYDSSGVENDLIDCGYSSDGKAVRYNVNTTAGSVTIGSATEGLRGDANVDNKVNMADAVAVLQNLANSEKYPLTAQGLINADCDGTNGLSGLDAIWIQMKDAGAI